MKNLLDFSRAETTTMTDVNVAQLLQETCQIAGNQIELNKIRRQQHIDPHLPTLHGNRQGLQQVFLNLIINAVQAMPDGGNLMVSAIRDENSRILVTVNNFIFNIGHNCIK